MQPRMPKKLTEDQKEKLSIFFSDLINYESDDPEEPIDPLNYVDSNMDNCLHLAVCRKNLDVVKILLDAGVDANSIGDMGCTPLHYAVKKNSQDIVDILIEYGASSEIRNEFGKLPFEYK